MAKATLTAVTIVLLVTLVGCHPADGGSSQLANSGRGDSLETVRTGQSTETDIVEQVAISRQAYMNGLEKLLAYYDGTGNNMKLGWVSKELAGLKSVVQYNYVIEAGVAGPDLRATIQIAGADALFDRAFALEQKARGLVVIVDEDKLRGALQLYNELISQYPSSDKIGDAAYQAARICEHFSDYTLAVLYFQRVYQWDPDTTHFARFKAAYVLDRRLHRRAEALKLYRQAVEKEALSVNYKEFAQMRIIEMADDKEAPQ